MGGYTFGLTLVSTPIPVSESGTEFSLDLGQILAWFQARAKAAKSFKLPK